MVGWRRGIRNTPAVHQAGAKPQVVLMVCSERRPRGVSGQKIDLREPPPPVFVEHAAPPPAGIQRDGILPAVSIERKTGVRSANQELCEGNKIIETPQIQ